MYKEHCLDTYDKCINDIVAPKVDAPMNIDNMKSPWLVYSNNILECNKLFDFCNKHLDEKELEELEREYELLVKEAGTKNSGGYKAKKSLRLRNTIRIKNGLRLINTIRLRNTIRLINSLRNVLRQNIKVN